MQELRTADSQRGGYEEVSFPLRSSFEEPRPRARDFKFLARPSWLTEVSWPFATYSVEVEGHRLALTDVGRGPVLMFVHTGLWSFIWRDLIRLLASEFRCVCFDSPGTGLSERLPVGEISLAKAARVAA